MDARLERHYQNVNGLMNNILHTCKVKQIDTIDDHQHTIGTRSFTRIKLSFDFVIDERLRENTAGIPIFINNVSIIFTALVNKILIDKTV